MDWDRYKQVCDTPNVFSRWMLIQTGELLEPVLAHRLLEIVSSDPVAKPADHQGGEATDMFVLRLSMVEVDMIVATVEEAVSAGRTTSGTGRRGLGGFSEAWSEYLAALRSGAIHVP